MGEHDRDDAGRVVRVLDGEVGGCARGTEHGNSTILEVAVLLHRRGFKSSSDQLIKRRPATEIQKSAARHPRQASRQRSR